MALLSGCIKTNIKEVKLIFYSCTITHTDGLKTRMVLKKLIGLRPALGDTITLTTHDTFKEALLPLLVDPDTITQTDGVLLHLQGGRTEVFETASEAARFLGVSPAAVASVLRGKPHCKTAGGAVIESLGDVLNGLQWAVNQEYIHECENDMYYSSPLRKEDLELIKHWSDKLKGLKND